MALAKFANSERLLRAAAERRKPRFETVPAVLPSGLKILFLGQAPGREECRKGAPFVGPAGQELQDWCRLVGIPWGHVGRTNVFTAPLPEEGLEALTQPEPCGGLPAIGKGRYLKEEYQHHLTRLAAEIDAVKPNIIVGLGAEALWALKGSHEITQNRGAIFMSKYGVKALATYHPSFIIRPGGGRKMRNVCLIDLLKAKINSDTPELLIKQRTLWLNPALEDMMIFESTHVRCADLLFLDIENDYPKSKTDTKWLRQITHFGVAASPYQAMSVPLSFKRVSYWKTAEEELEAVKWIKHICECPIPKALQNGLHDAKWLWDMYRIKVINYKHDLRLLHHALFPDLRKDLGFIGSLWADEFAWKLLGKSNKGDD